MIKKYINSLNIFFQKHKRLLLSLFLFLFIFISLGVQFNKWWFIGGADDYGDTYELGYKTQNWKWNKLFYFFYDGHTQPDLDNPNYKRTTFFTTSYRPLYCIEIALKYRLLGTNIYYYHLINVFLHAINTVALFNIFLWFIALFPAFLLALIWAFHPLIAWSFGNLTNSHYYINLFLMFLLIILFKKYLDSKKWYYNLLACITYATSLFVRETTIVYPAIIFFGTYLYQNRFNQISIQNFFKNFITTLKTTFGIISLNIGFLLLRLYLYPIDFSNSNTINTHMQKPYISIFAYFKNFTLAFFSYFKLFIYDLFGLSLIPWDPEFKIIRFGLFALILFLFCWLFIKNNRKIYVLYFIFCMLIMLWHSYFKGIYAFGYFYECYHFIFIALICLIIFYKNSLLKFKKIGLTILSIITLLFVTLTIKTFSRREQTIDNRAKAIKEIAYNPIITNKSLYFLALPYGAFETNTKKAFFMLLNNPNMQIFFDISFGIRQTNIYTDRIPAWKTFFGKYYSEKFITGNYIQIIPLKNSFRFQTTNPNKVFFQFDEQQKTMGKKIINKKININGDDLITDFTILFDPKDISPNTLFISWDYEKAKFKILDIF